MNKNYRLGNEIMIECASSSDSALKCLHFGQRRFMQPPLIPHLWSAQ